MLLKINATGSSGNNYHIKYNDEILLLDAGLPIKDIKKAIDFDIGSVVGCVVTHKHL